MRYRTTIEVEAVQWRGDNLEEARAFAARVGAIVELNMRLGSIYVEPRNGLGPVTELDLGGWVVERGRTFEAVTDADFRARYTPVDDGPANGLDSPLARAIMGSLKSCIDAHGPIELSKTGSAAKRVMRQLEAGGYLAQSVTPVEAAAQV